MKETTNFGFKKPEENEFYDVNVQNDNMDEIDRVLQGYKDGTQQVGDSAKLGGKNASEYAYRIDGDITGSESILEKAKTLGVGVWNFRFASGHDGTDLPMSQYKNGTATVFVRSSNYVSVYLWGSSSATNSRRIASNFWNGTEWTGWNVESWTSDLANYLPLSGGAFDKGKYISFQPKEVGGNEVGTYFKNADGSYFGGVGIKAQDGVCNYLFVSPYGDDTSHASKCLAIYPDVIKWKNQELLHTGNKPTGTYTGNGSATERTINVGGIGDVLYVKNANNFAIVSTSGAIVANDSGVTRLSKEEAFFANGVLTLKTTNNALNGNLATYPYELG